jgi:hypothetical protein
MNPYPEKIPEGISSIDTFPFSIKAGKSAKNEIENQLNAINDRIDKIVDHFVFSDIPILMYVLKATRQKSDLKKMAKAIDRLADLVQAQDDLSSRLNVINTLEADPTWFASTFSDYSDEIDRDLSFIIDNK